MNRINGKMRGNDPTGYLQKSSRRRILSLSAGALATGVAGCIGSPDSAGSDTDSTESPSDTPESSESEEDTTGHTWIDDPFSELNAPEEKNISGFEITGQATLDPGFFTEVEVPSNLPSQVSVNLSTEEENMDVYLLDRGTFNQYVEGADVDFSDTLSVTDTNNVEETYQAEPDNYNLVFDNSGVYGSQPEASVQFDFEVTTTPNNPLIEETEPPEVVRSADQPKIVEIRDNLGHTFTEEGDGLRPPFIEDKVAISDDTIIKLRVTKIAAQDGDDITYSYRFLQRSHRYNTGHIPNSSWAWDLQRTDYQNSIAFRIEIKNKDDIYYAGQGPRADDYEDIRYSNLTLDE
jgi:hypothetical protein